MSGLASSVFHDLRQRKLLPVAILLLVAAVALPLVALKPAEEAAEAPAAPVSSASTQSVNGLPSPEQALSDKPLVSLAVLEQPSDLDEFESKNPFKPLEEVGDGGASPGGSPEGPDLASTVPGQDAGGSSGSGTGSTGSGGSSGGSGGSTGGSDGGSGQGGSPSPKSAPKQDTPAPKTEKKLTYALDLTIRGPKGLRSYRGLPKLSLLPATDNPLLVFLGIEDAGTKAVFLVDAKLRSQSGEGACAPSPEQCATLALAPGEEHVLANEAGETWTVRIVEVRETSVAKAAAAARRAQKRRAGAARRSVSEADRPAPRFTSPLITDLFTGGRS